MVRISVIVPVRSDPRLARCLDGLARQTLARDRYEVIVADNGPDPAMRDLAARHSARYVVEPEGGSYAARARGAGVARGEVLAFTDADCLPPPAWLATIDSLFEDPACRVVVGPSEATERSVVANWVQGIDEARWDDLARAGRIAFCDTRNLALRRDVLAAVPFDPAFRHAGDLDLGLRLHAAGIEIRPAPALRLAHDHPRSLRAVLARAIRRGRGLAALERKHGSSGGPSGGSPGSSGGSFGGPIGERPLRIAGRDVKAAVLRLARRPAGRGLLIPPTVVALGPLLLILSVLAHLPSGEKLGGQIFVLFERLALLLGRLTGNMRGLVSDPPARSP